jgi:DNA-binding SARP family transcriptional activator
MSGISVTLFGRFDVRYAGRSVDGLNKHRAREVLSYLLLHRAHPYPRETLATLLWEDLPADHASKYLRQAVWQIQSTLRSQSEAAEKSCLTADAEWIQFRTDSEINVDVFAFEHAFAACQGVSGSQLDDAHWRALQYAVELYRGDLLEGWYQDWCVFERERLQNNYLAMLDKLVAGSEAHRDVECGLAYAQRILRCDPAREQTHYAIMRLHCMAGNRTQAIRQYQHCEKVLMQELGVRPSQRTSDLHESIRADHFAALISDPPAPRPLSTVLPIDCNRLTALLSVLQQLQGVLAELGSQLQSDIQALQRMLRD